MSRAGRAKQRPADPNRGPRALQRPDSRIDSHHFIQKHTEATNYTYLCRASLTLLNDNSPTADYQDTLATQAAAGATDYAAIQVAVDNSIAKTVFIQSIYRRILRCEVDGPNYYYWSSMLGTAGYDRHKMEGELYATAEFWNNAGSTNAGYVFALYRDIQHRDGGAEGTDWWVGQLNAGVSRFEVARSFLASPENITNVVNQVHQTVFSRPAKPEELNFWLPQLHLAANYEETVAHLLGTVEMATEARRRRTVQLRTGF